LSKNSQPQNYRKYIEFLALCVLALAILWWFGRNLDWREVRHSLSNSNPYLLSAATLIICAAYMLRAFRWGALLRPLGPSRLADLFAATTIGFGAVFLLGRAGEVVRPVVLPMRDARVRASASFVTILIERIYDFTAVALMFAINLIWFKPPVALENDFARVRIVGVGLLALTLLGIVFLAWFRMRSAIVIDGVGRLFSRWHFIPQRLAKLVIGMLEQLSGALRVLVNLGELAETLGWTALVWLGIAGANLLVMRAFGLHFGLSETIFVLGWSLVGSLVPTPGGAAGAFHAATAAGLIFLRVEKETAAAISIVMHLVDFGPAVLFGFFYLIRGDLSLSRLRALVSPQAVEHVVEDEELLPNGIPTNNQALENGAIKNTAGD
jgi:glycosyltransferase 2 family protein